ncbi:MAG: 16S rRNA (adenine(1518)-N(6)/adenine(1519)-N(6))-dimethyltransferase RsmA [Oscillospiraceae bacterium]|nr:16S rRNA (adenine(1518)-N(6)/adenine(1519)-N(6))-dimethyltransferase RsmA [Oscillospiraceae bacterium]
MEDLTNIGRIKELMERYGFSFSKALGQNFLINPSVCPKIAELGNAGKGFGVIEIGTGFGTLTAELAKRADKVVAVELDSRLMPVLEETLAEYDNVSVINADVMKTDLRAVIEDNFAGLETAVCANLPYYITSPIIMYLLESRLPIQSITVMVQKEAGQRLCAKMGTRESSAVTAAVNYYAVPKMLFSVSRGSFMPPPNVDSCVIRLDVRKEPPIKVKDEKFLFRVIRGVFSQRRKNIVNSLSSALGDMDISKENISAAAADAGISLSARAEQLTLEDYGRLADRLI